MSTLTSASTLAQVQAAYDDNASYDEDASVTKARAFVTAARILLGRLAKRQVHGGRSGGEEVELDLQLIRDELTAAKKWLAAHGTGTGIRHTSVENLRA